MGSYKAVYTIQTEANRTESRSIEFRADNYDQAWKTAREHKVYLESQTVKVIDLNALPPSPSAFSRERAGKRAFQRLDKRWHLH